jgi:uncharacterized repeat protein (TIGR01451 family)
MSSTPPQLRREMENLMQDHFRSGAFSPPSKARTGPASPGRLVCAHGAIAWSGSCGPYPILKGLAMRFTPFAPRRGQQLRRQLWVEALEDRVTPSPLGLVPIDGSANTGGLGPCVITAPASAGATPPPELEIHKEVTRGFPDVIHPGDTASFTISVTNNYGAGEAVNVLGTDQLPAADLLTWVIDSSTFDVTSISTNDFLTFASNRLAAGATASVTVHALIPLDLFGGPPGGTGNLPSGPFELDGNATTGVPGTPGSPTASHDWDQVFLDVVNRTSTSGAIAGSFVTDAVKSTRDDVFTGRSGDTHGIQAGPWRFEDSKPQASNDIAHAYAATYRDPNYGHVLLFAGLDRYDSGGDAGAGFWFFHNPIGENPSVTSNGGHPFTGQHADGDMLLVSEFTPDGSASAVKVFRWTGDDSTGTLVPLTAPEDTTFAVANGAAITVPWSFTDKRHNSGPAAGEFLEVGVDLTALGLGGCFSSFLADTRASPSPTATLSDFVLGTFNSCRLELPNTATVGADGIDPIDSNLALITVVPEDVAPQTSPEQSAPAPAILAGPMTVGHLPPWLTDVPAGVAAPAGHAPWQHLASDAASALTPDEFVIGTFNSCRLELPNTATVGADGIDPIDSNLALITGFLGDAERRASPERSAPAPAILAGPMTVGHLPPWLTDVPAGVAAPAGHAPWQRLTSDAGSAVTGDEDEPAAVHVANVERVFRMVGEEDGLALGKGSDRDDDLLEVMGDLCQPDREALTPLDV